MAEHICKQRCTHSPIAKEMNALMCGCITAEQYRAATDPMRYRGPSAESVWDALSRRFCADPKHAKRMVLVSKKELLATLKPLFDQQR